VKDFSGDAISASLVPSEYQAGVGGGVAFSPAAIGGVTNVPVNGRNFTELSTLAPGIALVPGQLSGYVIDFSGATIPNARVDVQNTATRSTLSASTTAEGYWLIMGLSSGTYQVTVSAPGFQSLSVPLAYDASNPHAYRFALNLGLITQSVEVSASSMMLNTASSSTQFSKKQKRDKGAAPMAPAPPPPASANVFNLQQRVVGVLPVSVDIPRAGTSYRFLRPLVVNEETNLAFTYKSK
jgi:hypothetical protein